MNSTTFLRVLSDNDKGLALQEAVNQVKNDSGGRVFFVNPQSFHQISGSPFAYWTSDKVRRLFIDLPPFESEGRTVKQGLATADDFRFVRAWWEVQSEKILDAQNGPDWREDVEKFQDWCRNRTTQGKKWVPFAKGGEYSPFYADIHLVVNWENNGDELCSFKGSVIRNPNYYFRPGITWPARPLARGSFSVVPPGVIPSHVGMMIYSDIDSLRRLIGVLNSDVFIELLHLLMPRGTGNTGATLKYEIGYVTAVPIPDHISYSDSYLQLIELVNPLYNMVMAKKIALETSIDFSNLSDCTKADQAFIQKETNLDDIACHLYGVDRDSLPKTIPAISKKLETYDPYPLGAQFSVLIGQVFGRFSIKHTNCFRDMFEPIAVCSPSILKDGDSLPAKECPQGYPLMIPIDGILVDDESANRDIVQRIQSVIATCFDEKSADYEFKLCRLMGCESLRTYLRKSNKDGFWDRHIKQYSKSRRKAPIYWQLSIPSSKYSVWLYYHRFNEDTLYKVLSEYVVPKVQSEERKLEILQREYSPKPTASQSNEISEQESLLNELRWMREELEMVAPLWNPNLDDGVELNFAPLWRLVPQNKSWQKHIKSRWDELCSSKYDWSYIAMRLWPERAIHACISDRSIAIAHGLEDALWIQEDSGWKPRDVSSNEVDRLISERSTKPVQDALEKLLSAPAPLRRGKERARNER